MRQYVRQILVVTESVLIEDRSVDDDQLGMASGYRNGYERRYGDLKCVR